MTYVRYVSVLWRCLSFRVEYTSLCSEWMNGIKQLRVKQMTRNAKDVCSSMTNMGWKCCTSGNDKFKVYSQSLRHYISKTGVYKGTAEGDFRNLTVQTYRSVRDTFRYSYWVRLLFLQCLQRTFRIILKLVSNTSLQIVFIIFTSHHTLPTCWP